MAAQDKALERVVNKLTELRMRFDPDERAILDRMITGEAAEVTGHAAAADAAISDAAIAGRVVFDEEAVAYKVIDF